MKDAAVTRDNYLAEVQKLSGTALSIIGSLISSIYEGDPELKVEDILHSLLDASKFLTLIIYKQTKSRKAFIEPGLVEETKALLKDCKTDEYLYGKEWAEKAKERKTLKNMSQNFKSQPPKGNLPTQTSKPTFGQGLNRQTSFARRPQMQMGSTSSGGRLRQPVFSRNRQQFANNRAQMPPQQQKFRPKQDRKQ